MTEKITTAEDLDALPVGSVVVNPFDNTEYHKTRTGKWVQSSGDLWLAEEIVRDDQEVVLYRPDAPAPSPQPEDALCAGLDAIVRHWPDALDECRGDTEPECESGDDCVRDVVASVLAARQPAPLPVENFGAFGQGYNAALRDAARQPAPAVSAELVDVLALTLRQQVDAGTPFQTTIRMWLQSAGVEVTP